MMINLLQNMLILGMWSYLILINSSKADELPINYFLDCENVYNRSISGTWIWKLAYWEREKLHHFALVTPRNKIILDFRMSLK